MSAPTISDSQRLDRVLERARQLESARSPAEQYRTLKDLVAEATAFLEQLERDERRRETGPAQAID